MIRSLFSALLAIALMGIIFLILPALLIVIAAALLLGVGWLLTRWFAVTVFEAALITTILAVPIVWFYYRILGNTGLVGAEPEVKATPAPELPRSFERLMQVPRRRRRGQ